jgi:VWFA-related protein
VAAEFMLRTLAILSFCAITLALVCTPAPSAAQAGPAPAALPTIRVTSRLVFLDVTVLDKKGHPVLQGLTKDDFAITEEKRPQRIFSFEEPTTHVVDSALAQDDPAGKAPLTIIVLDLLNSGFADSAYIRYSVRRYLVAQPDRLTAPAELMVLGNRSLEMVQGYTRSKEDLLYALDHVPAALPWKYIDRAFYAERFGQSIDALQQIALQNKGVSGRKNIVWVGHGGPSIITEALVGPIVDELNQYVRDTTNMLVDARVSLFVIYPGLKPNSPALTFSEGSAAVDIGDSDPFAGDINVGVFVNETGGKLFYNRNDVDREIARSEELGSAYYTLTYQPEGGIADGKFRRIRVTMREPGLRALTKAGYFAPDQRAPVDPRQQTMASLAEAAQGTIPFHALDVSLKDLVRHPDTRTAAFTVVLQPRNIHWDEATQGKSTAQLALAAMSLSADGDILASKRETLLLTVNTQDPARLAATLTNLPLLLRVPRKTRNVRVAIQSVEGGRIGTAELDRKAIDAAPAAPTPAAALQPRPQVLESSPPPAP